MRNIPKNSAYTLLVLMTSATDHISGIPGLSLQVQISKAGSAFTTIYPTIQQLGFGWYSIILSQDNTNTQGDLAIHIEAIGADPTDVIIIVGTAVISQAFMEQDIPGAVWTNPFVSKLLTVGKFLGLK